MHEMQVNLLGSLCLIGGYLVIRGACFLCATIFYLFLDFSVFLDGFEGIRVGNQKTRESGEKIQGIWEISRNWKKSGNFEVMFLLGPKTVLDLLDLAESPKIP